MSSKKQVLQKMLIPLPPHLFSFNCLHVSYTWGLTEKRKTIFFASISIIEYKQNHT